MNKPKLSRDLRCCRWRWILATDLLKREAVLNGQKEAQVISLG